MFRKMDPRTKSATPIFAALAVSLWASSAHAHFSLDFPKARSMDIDAIPCGAAGSTRGSTVTTFRPGETITLQWTIMIEHGGHKLWRVAIDDSGQDFPDPVTANDTSTLPFFMDKIEVSGKGMHTLDITLPMISCDNCTLQMVQYTYDTPPYPGFYHQCADIVIAGDPVGGTTTTTTGGSSAAATTSGGGTGGSSSTTGGAGAAGSSGTGSSGTGSSSTGSSGTGSSGASSTGTGAPQSVAGGCSVVPGTRPAHASYGVIVVALVAGGMRRSRRRTRERGLSKEPAPTRS
jgi:hypothetical protein